MPPSPSAAVSTEAAAAEGPALVLTGSGLSPDVAHSVVVVYLLTPCSCDGTGGLAGAPSLSAFFGSTVLVLIVEFKGSRFVIHLEIYFRQPSLEYMI